MHDERVWIWGGIFVLFVVFRALRTFFRGVTGAKSNDGMARLNAAAERILKQRSGSNPIPRTGKNPLPRTGKNPLPRTGRPSAKPKPQAKPVTSSSPVLKGRSAPAVIP